MSLLKDQTRKSKWFALVVAALIAVSSALGTSFAQTEIVIYTPTRYGEMLERTLGQHFLSTYGARIVWQDMVATEMMAKVIAERNAPEASVVCPNVLSYLQTKDAGIWAQLDPAIVTNRSELFEQALASLDDHGVPLAANTLVIQYRSDIFQDQGFAPPTGFIDLARPEFQNRVLLTSTTSGVGTRTLISFARMNGGDEYNIDPGFTYAQSLTRAGQVHSFATSSSGFNELMQLGEVWIGVQFSEGAYQFKAAGAPVDFVLPAEGALLDFTTCHVLANAPQPELAQQLINLLIGEEFQREIALDRWAIPVRQNVELPEEYTAVLPLTPEQWSVLTNYDIEYVAGVRNDWHQRWIREIEAQ